jgi:hypothetical protein
MISIVINFIVGIGMLFLNCYLNVLQIIILLSLFLKLVKDNFGLYDYCCNYALIRILYILLSFHSFALTLQLALGLFSWNANK